MFKLLSNDDINKRSYSLSSDTNQVSLVEILINKKTNDFSKMLDLYIYRHRIAFYAKVCYLFEQIQNAVIIVKLSDIFLKM